MDDLSYTCPVCDTQHSGFDATMYAICTCCNQKVCTNCIDARQSADICDNCSDNNNFDDDENE